MLLLSAPFESGARAWSRRPPATYALVGVWMLLAAAVGPVVDALDPWRIGLAHALTAGAVHGGLIALGWLLAEGGTPGWRAPALGLGAVSIVASIAARWGPWGPAAFLLVPPALILSARGRPALRAMGVRRARPVHAMTGLAAGAFLGAHLLVTASLTFGYRVHVTGLGIYLGALAYDVGANVLSAEWLFRGALFTGWWRRGSFWPAALAATVLALVRYLLDPALPATVEARAGAVFYLGLMGLIACALRAWSGSLLPGYLAALGFFAAYRTLMP